eukprot:2924984-Prymnesium_polylepis.1
MPWTSGSPASARRSTVASFESSASFAKLMWIGPVSPAAVVHRWSVTCLDTFDTRRPTRGRLGLARVLVLDPPWSPSLETRSCFSSELRMRRRFAADTVTCSS